MNARKRNIHPMYKIAGTKALEDLRDKINAGLSDHATTTNHSWGKAVVAGKGGKTLNSNIDEKLEAKEWKYHIEAQGKEAMVSEV